MILEKMNPAHVAQIADLEKICFSDPWSERSIASELDNKLAFWLVATEGDTVAGYIGSQTVMDETDMMNVAVHPDFRRRGIAEALVNGLVEELKEKYPGRNILLVCHGGVCRVIRTFFEDMTNEEYFLYSEENAAVKEYEL